MEAKSSLMVGRVGSALMACAEVSTSTPEEAKEQSVRFSVESREKEKEGICDPGGGRSSRGVWGALPVAVGVRASGGFRVWGAEAAWPSGVTLRLGGGIPSLGRSPRTEAFLAGG
jgi:hypothetical protein